MATITHTEITSTTWREALVARYHGLKDYMQRRAVYRTTLAELSALSNRELADLGLSRSGLKRIAWETAFVN